MSRDQADKLAAAIAATIEYVGGPYCGRTEYIVGPVHFRRCWYDASDRTRIHIYALARDGAGRAVYRYQGAVGE